jgi:hypothetical protein
VRAAFNIVNGDIFRWRWLWPQLAAWFSVEAQGQPDPIAPLVLQMADAREVWAGMADKYGLITDPVVFSREPDARCQLFLECNLTIVGFAESGPAINSNKVRVCDVAQVRARKGNGIEEQVFWVMDNQPLSLDVAVVIEAGDL